MKQAILIVTWSGTTQYCLDLLKSLESYKDYPIVVAINEVENCKDTEFLKYLNRHNIETLPIEGNRWECGGLTAMNIFTSYDEFILLQDTIEIKDASVFGMMFDFENRSVSFGPGWQCYLGKYRKEVLDQLTIPITLSKMDSFYQEVRFGSLYNLVADVVERKPPIVLFSEWGNNNPDNYMENKFNRPNLVLANPYLIKRKSVSQNIGPFAMTIWTPRQRPKGG